MARNEAAMNDIAALVKGGYSVRAIRDEEDFTPLRGMKRFADLTRTPAQ